MQKKEGSKAGKDAKKNLYPDYLKWTWIIIVILAVLLIGAFDYCTRTGNI